MSLPEAKELAKRYPLPEEEINEYVLMGLSNDEIEALCEGRMNGLRYEHTRFVAEWMRNSHAEKFNANIAKVVEELNGINNADNE